MNLPSLLTYPDPRLRAVAEQVDVFDEGLALLAVKLVEAVETAPAIGLAAPHIGVLRRLIAARSPKGDGIRVYVNPVIEWASAEMSVHEEGSVSMPGITAEVERARSVRVAYCGIDGVGDVEDAEGFHAAVLQHEIDQLDGVFWIDRLSRLKRERLIKRFQKLGGRSAPSTVSPP